MTEQHNKGNAGPAGETAADASAVEQEARPDDQASAGESDPAAAEGVGAGAEGEGDGPGEERTETETVYESGPSGHRITRRKVRRREMTEEVDETITEDIPFEAYQAPSSSHPLPVG